MTPEQILLRAVESLRGIRVVLPSERLWGIRLQLYKVRERHRRLSRRIYNEDDPRWGKSQFDHLTVTFESVEKARLTTPEDVMRWGHWLVIENTGATNDSLTVEDL